MKKLVTALTTAFFKFLLLYFSVKFEFPFSKKKINPIAHNKCSCECYNRFDFNTGVIFRCNASSHNGDTKTKEMVYKNQKIYFGDTDIVNLKPFFHLDVLHNKILILKE